MSATTASKPPAVVCPALESGDRMDAAEFHWRYERRPDIKKAELIDGVVYVASPPNFSRHGVPRFNLIGQLGSYTSRAPGIVGAVNPSMLVGGMDEPQPDVALYWDAAHGGQTQLDGEGWLVSAPDLVAEVAHSSRSYDLTVKKDLYRRIGVREYIVWQVEDGRIDWWRLDDGSYVPLAPDESGAVHSVVFPGLALNVPSLLAKVPGTKLPRRLRSRK